MGGNVAFLLFRKLSQIEVISYIIKRKKGHKKMNAILKEGFEKFGINPTDEIEKKLNIFADMLVETNEKVNLTSITERDEIYSKHFVDSVSCQGLIKDGATVIDVGTGAGFPGIVLKIARPDIKITLLDSLRKRVDFLESVISELGLEGITAVHSRAEDAAVSDNMREKYDVAVSRAVANLPVLCEYCLPFVKIGGSFLALKGRDADNEVKNAEKAVKILGGKTEKTEKVFWNNMEHRVVIIRKISKTPPKFPRKAGKPSKDPII